MIVHKISTVSGLIQKMNNLAREYCLKHKLPRIPVLPDDGSIEPEARAHFNWKKQKILVSSRLLNYIWKYPDKIKVWGLFSSIRHELRHYEQYVFMVSHGITPSRDKFDEYDAILTGRLWADNKIRKLTNEEINPLTSKEKSEIRNWANLQYGIAQKYQDYPVRSSFYKGRSVGMGKVAQVYNPRRVIELDKIKAVGKRGDTYIWVKVNGREGVIPNKYSKSWWDKATEKDIRRVIVY